MQGGGHSTKRTKNKITEKALRILLWPLSKQKYLLANVCETETCFQGYGGAGNPLLTDHWRQLLPMKKEAKS